MASTLTEVATYNIVKNGEYDKTVKSKAVKINKEHAVTAESLKLNFDPNDTTSEKLQKVTFVNGQVLFVKDRTF